HEHRGRKTEDSFRESLDTPRFLNLLSGMHRRFYTVTRDLHLYLGLFISPFVLVFSVTVFFFVHAIAPKFGAETTQTRAPTAVSLPPDLSKLSGRPLIDALKPMLSSMNVPGEIGYIRHVVSDDTLVIPVSVPG